MTTHTYRNPWHDPFKAWYGPEFYKTDKKPVEYRGFLMFQRITGSWDLVKDGVCLTQRRGVPRGAVDALCGDASECTARIQGIAARFGVVLPRRKEG